MSKKTVQSVVWPIVHAAWVIAAILLVSRVIIAPLVNYVVPSAWYDWLASSVGSLVIMAVIYLLATIVVLLPIALFLQPRFSELRVMMGLKNPPQLSMIPWSLMAWGLYFGISLFVAFLLSLVQIPGFDLYQKQEVGFVGMQHPYEFIAAFLALVVLAPLFEEIIFRGYLYGRLRKYWGVVLSAALTSLVFGIVHFQLNVGIDVFILSLFLCFLREKFESIWPGFFVHAFKNGLAYIFLFILPLYGINLIQ